MAGFAGGAIIIGQVRPGTILVDAVVGDLLDPGVDRRIVIVAGSVGVAMFALGALLQQILHFSIGALNIIGGLILLLGWAILG